MVTFTCAHCGESVKKPVVSRHYERKCHGRLPDLTCVDCLKDFRGSEYEAHTKCISESERYGAKGSIQPNTVNKGEQKQQLWSECIQNVLSSNTLRDDERRLIGLLAKHENVPRKKAKFQNFLNSAYKSCRFSNDLIDRVWVRMESVFKETKESTGNNKQETKGKTVDEKEDQSESKKRKHEEEEEKKTDPPADEPEIKKSKKSKKKKKENDSDAAQGDNQVENNINHDESASQIESNKKKDKKKKKKSLETEDKIEETPEESAPLINGEGKKKKKKVSETGNEVEEKPAEEAVPLMNGEGKKKKKKKKKEKNEQANENQEKINGNENVTESKTQVNGEPLFLWVENIKSVLSKYSDEKILFKKIEKKVLKRYSKATGNEITEKLSNKIQKKLKKIPNVTLHEEYVIVHK